MAERWHGVALDAAVIPIGVGLAVGLGAAAILTPEWVVGGAPLVSGYPKSVELAAGTLAVASGGLATALTAWRPGRAAVAALAVIGYGMLAASHPQALPIGVPVLALAAALAVALDRCVERPAGPAAADEPGRARLWVLALSLLLFVVCAGPIRLDLYHHGEVLISARDLLAGGRPFVTFQWMHGATDSAVTALWMRLTGKSGSSPVVLMIATNIALGIPALYLLARRAVGSALATALGVGALAAALPFVWSLLHPLLGLRSAGMMIFLGVAVALVGPQAWRCLLAGAAVALAHVYRIDAGLFGALALAAVAAVQSLRTAPRWPARLAQALRAALALAAGATFALAGLRLALGWPGPAWYAYVFGPLPRLHAISNGLPYPWPGRADPGDVACGAIALALPVVLIAAAARATRRTLRPADRPLDPARVDLLVFLAVFAVAALHTALGRSDRPHLLHWTLPVLYATGLLASANALRRMAAAPRRAHRALALGAAVLLAAIVADPKHLPRQLVQHLRPNPPVGACADTLFTPNEARDPRLRRFIDRACAAQQILATLGVTRLVMDDGAPWYLEQFHLPLPSRFYAWYLARTPDEQWAAIDDLRRLDPQALLQPRGDGAVEIYDVPTAHLAPIVAAYLRGRGDGAPRGLLPIGTLVLWNLPAPPEPPPGPFDAALVAAFDGAVYDSQTGFLDASGWTYDPTAAAPLTGLSLAQPPGVASADLRTGFARPDAASVLGRDQPLPNGFRFVTRVPPEVLRDPRMGLQLVGAGRRQRFAPLDAMPVRVLPRRAGGWWDDLPAQVEKAEALGRADRAAALAAHAADTR